MWIQVFKFVGRDTLRGNIDENRYNFLLNRAERRREEYSHHCERDSRHLWTVAPPAWRSQKQAGSKTAPKDVYQGLRDSAFQNSRAKLGLPLPSTPTQPWGVIMDWGVTEGDQVSAPATLNRY